MKVIITNVVSLNGGDAAILTALVQLLKDTFGTDTQFLVMDSQPKIAARYYPEFTFRHRLHARLNQAPRIPKIGRLLHSINLSRLKKAAWGWRSSPRLASFLLSTREWEAFQEYASADLIISTGGTYLVENYDLQPSLLEYEIILLLGRPLIFFTQSLGPFSDPDHRQRLKSIFEQARLILVRDRKSLTHLQDLRLKQAPVRITADAAFALNPPAIARTEKKSAPMKIVLSVRSWPYFKTLPPHEGMARYQLSVREAIIYLVEKYQAKITFLSTCQGIPEYWMNDSKIAWEIQKTLPPAIAACVTLDEKFHRPEELIKILREQDFAISTRMHMTILSLMAGTPVLPIAYEFKTQELFDQLGQSDLPLDIESLSPDRLKQSIDDFICGLAEYRKSVFPMVTKLHQEARQASQWIRKVSL